MGKQYGIRWEEFGEGKAINRKSRFFRDKDLRGAFILELLGQKNFFRTLTYLIKDGKHTTIEGMEII